MLGRVIFLIVIAVAFVGISVGVWTVTHDNSDTTLFPVALKVNTDIYSEPILVPFVVVTRFQNMQVLDLADVSGVIWVSDDFAGQVGELPYWERSGHVLTSAPSEAMEEFLDDPTDDVWVIPYTSLRPSVRSLKVQGQSVFDFFQKSSQWPLTVTLPDGWEPTSVFEDISEIAIGGTVVLSRGVAERINKNQDSFYPWQEVAKVLEPADFSIVNFKGAITSDCVYDGYTLRFCGTPGYLDGMVMAGVDAVTVSGNHVGDYGQIGLRETVEFLHMAGIKTTGLGQGYDEAFAPVVYEMPDGTTIALIAYNNVFGTAPCAQNTQQWGVTCLLDRQIVTTEIVALKTQYDIVIAYPNWGPEYVHVPDMDKQVVWGRIMADSGADLVVGDQAHWVQAMEFHQGTPIFYGLGNFVFDQMWSEKTREGLLLRVFIHQGKILAIEPIPTKIHDYAQPQIASGTEGHDILKYLALPLDASN